MNSSRFQRRKWTLKAHGQQGVFIYNAGERSAHVFMKAFLWAMYLPQYPNMKVEVKIGDRFKPDVVSLNAEGQPVFWGEAGRVSKKKIESLSKRYRNTHLVVAKWEMSLKPLEQTVTKAVRGLSRTAPIELLRFEPRHVELFINDDGEVKVDAAFVERRVVDG